MIRPAKPSDIPRIVELGVESLEVNGDYDNYVIDTEKIRQTAVECISSPQNFAWVSEIDGEVVGAVGALSVPFLFFERSQCSVVMFYCRVPGDGGRLIKKLFSWYKSRPALKALEFTLERKENTRLIKFLEKLGLKTLPVMFHERGSV